MRKRRPYQHQAIQNDVFRIVPHWQKTTSQTRYVQHAEKLKRIFQIKEAIAHDFVTHLIVEKWSLLAQIFVRYV